MSLTVIHNNGKFTCDFTPDGEASVQINSAGPVKVNVDFTGDADQQLNRDNEDIAERGEVTASDLEEMSTDTIYVSNSLKRKRDHTRNGFARTK